MVFKLCAMAAMAMVAQAQTSMITAVNDVVVNRVAFQVVFSSCVESVTPSNFRITGATTSNGVCTETVTNQKFSCTFDVSAGGDVIEIWLPGNTITDLAGQRVALDSNVLEVHQYNQVTGVLNTIPESTNKYSSNHVTFAWTVSSDHAVYWTGNSPFSASVDGQELAIESSAFSAMQFLFSVHANYGDTVTARINAGVARDAAGNSNGALTISRLLEEGAVDTPQPTPNPTNPPSTRQPTPSPTEGAAPTSPIVGRQDCVVSEWGPWSECTRSCTTYTATFEKIDGVRSRTRTVVQDAANGGNPCPALTKVDDSCAGGLCFELDQGSRPFAAEDGGECQNCQVQNPFVGGKDDRDEFREAAGCYCDSACEANEDCCQGYYKNDCCSLSDCSLAPEYLPDWSPLTCAPSDCLSTKLKKDPEYTSYRCACEPQCVVDSTCCGGSASRSEVC